MKKLWLVSALSLGLVLLAGCNTTTTQTPVTITSSEDMISFYNEAKDVTCVLNYDSWEEQGVSTIYIKDWMIKQDTKSTVGEDSLSMYTLARDNQMYVWWDIYWEGVWFYASYDLNVEEELSAFDEMDEYTKISCTKGVKDDSVFTLPSDIEFTSMDEWLDTEYDEGLWEYENETYEEYVEEENNEEVVEENVEEENVAEEVVEEEVNE